MDKENRPILCVKDTFLRNLSQTWNSFLFRSFNFFGMKLSGGIF